MNQGMDACLLIITMRYPYSREKTFMNLSLMWGAHKIMQTCFFDLDSISRSELFSLSACQRVMYTQSTTMYVAREDRVCDAVVDQAEGKLNPSLLAMLEQLYTPYAENKVSEEEEEEGFSVNVVSGGITNALYLCTVPGFRPVLVRLFGASTELFIDREKERHWVKTLSRNEFGPAVHGYFANGRLEGFIGQSRCPGVSEMWKDTRIQESIASELCAMHRLRIGESEAEMKTPAMFSVLDSWAAQASNADLFDADVEQEKEKREAVQGMDLPAVAQVRLSTVCVYVCVCVCMCVVANLFESVLMTALNL
jgi:hypothetical protein